MRYIIVVISLCTGFLFVGLEFFSLIDILKYVTLDKQFVKLSCLDKKSILPIFYILYLFFNCSFYLPQLISFMVYGYILWKSLVWLLILTIDLLIIQKRDDARQFMKFLHPALGIGNVVQPTAVNFYSN